MGSYILKRILLFIPTLLILSIVGFTITINAPGDPVERLFTGTGESNTSHNTTLVRRLKKEKRHELGLDLPVFYFSIGTLADADPYQYATESAERNAILQLSRYAGNDAAIKDYEQALQKLEERLTLFPDGNARDILSVKLQDTRRHGNMTVLEDDLHELNTTGARYGNPEWAAPLRSALGQIKNGRNAWKVYIPAIHFYGLHNQYHRWLSNIILHGNLGLSYRTQLPLMRQLKSKMGWSVTLSLLSLVLAYAISIPIGMYAAYRQNGLFDKLSGTLLFALYSIPAFFGGMLLLLLFANPDILNWFPEGGIADPTVYDPNWPFFERLLHHLPYLVLPVITYTYGSLAFYSRQMRIGAVEIMQQDFIRTARAKGLPDSAILWKHIFRNALLPILTLFADAFPLAVAGSVIIETIFAIPGMGQELYNAMLSYDYPVVVGVFLIFGTMTLAGYLVSDILYAVADPRISYKSR